MIQVEGLRKRFEDFDAVRGVSFEVPEGEIFGFIGPNGAGKTTTIRILATLLQPSAGRARILGLDVTEEPERVREVMGYMPDLWGVYPDLTVREYLSFFAASYGMPRRERARAVDSVWITRSGCGDRPAPRRGGLSRTAAGGRLSSLPSVPSTCALSR